MDWSEDTDFEVILTHEAEIQAQNILDYIFYELKNPQAAYGVEQDMQKTIQNLSHTANHLKLCDEPELRAMDYRTIHLKHHKYFLLYKIIDSRVYVVSIYHDLQDYENVLR